ncbi:MAG: alkyl hydroperoxide reductase [Bacteroidetes bacterium]|nr:MAG: alkyl hydroperoxide reductase [Bacteroidota bacterium]
MNRKVKPLIGVSLVLILSIITISSLTPQGVTPLGIQVGEKAPMFEAITLSGEPFNLKEATSSGPVVVVFYRGQWCPICNKHLSNLQDSLSLILDLGAQVVAISPERPELLHETADLTGAEFTLVYDEGYKISDAYGVTFTPNRFKKFIYNTFMRASLRSAHSDDTQRLPVPATYVINKSGQIIWRQFDTDYYNRSSVKEIINALN